MFNPFKFNPTDLFNQKLRIRKLLKNKDVIEMLRHAHVFGELSKSYDNLGQVQGEDNTFQKLIQDLEK